MKKLAVILLVAAVGGLVLATSASAHPLGNFTINHYSRIEPSGNRLYVLYVLDLAEIPTFQAKSKVAAEGEGRYATRLARSIGRHLELTVDGRRSTLFTIRRVLAFPPGQGAERAPQGLGNFLRQGGRDDAADVVGLEDAGAELHGDGFWVGEGMREF